MGKQILLEFRLYMYSGICQVFFCWCLYVCYDFIDFIVFSGEKCRHHENMYNFDPLKPHFYIVKLGFIGVYIIFLISSENINCGYSLEPPTIYVFRFFFYLFFHFLVVKFSVNLNRHVFVMYSPEDRAPWTNIFGTATKQWEQIMQNKYSFNSSFWV